MSLKAIHIVFITASTALAFVFAAWELITYSSSGQKSDLIYGLGSAVVGVALILYGRYFLKKLKDVSYL